jgi:hypothetical protein
MELSMPDLQYQRKYAPEGKPPGNSAGAMVMELAAQVRHSIFKYRNKDNFKIAMPELPALRLLTALHLSKSVSCLIC